MILSEVWCRLPPGALTAATLTAEGALLGDDGGLVVRVGPGGRLTAERPLPAPVRDLDAAGTRWAAACGSGEIVCLEEDRLSWRHAPDSGAAFVRMGPGGDHLLALDRRGIGVFLNRFGREMRPFRGPGPVHSVALVPDTGQVVVVSRDDTIHAFTAWGRHEWSASISPPAGPVAVSGDGSLVLVPALLFGVEAFTIAGEAVGAYEVGEPVKAVSCDARGETLLLATSEDRLVLLRRDASVISARTFPAPVAEVRLSPDGARALVRTTSGYVHLLAVGREDRAPLLEIDREVECGGPPRPVFSTRLFSPHTFFLQPRLAFSTDARLLAVGGDRQSVRVLGTNGDEIDRRRYGGSLMELRVTADRGVRVFGSSAVFSFRPGGSGTRPEWSGPGDLGRVLRHDRGVLALSEAGEVLDFPDDAEGGRRLFSLPDPFVTALALAGDRIGVLTDAGAFVVRDSSGEEAGRCGPWPVPARLLAGGLPGFLLGVGRVLLLVGPDGKERWRAALPGPVSSALALPGAFVVKDEADQVHSVTATGQVRRAFPAGPGRLVPCPDGGDGPGFLIHEGPLLRFVRPDGSPRFRYRAGEPISHVEPSPDGRLAAVFAGFDLIVLPLGAGVGEPARPADAACFLEFASGPVRRTGEDDG